MIHIHRRRPVGPVMPPYALTRYGPLGRRRYRCRCGREWTRAEYQTEPMWREIQRMADGPPVRFDPTAAGETERR